MRPIHSTPAHGRSGLYLFFFSFFIFFHFFFIFFSILHTSWMLPSHEEERYLNKITAKSSRVKNEHTAPGSPPFPEEQGGAGGGRAPLPSHPAFGGPRHSPTQCLALGALPPLGFVREPSCSPFPRCVHLLCYVKKREKCGKNTNVPKSIIITVVAEL